MSYADPDKEMGQLLVALSNHRRRMFVRILEDYDPVELKTVAELIAQDTASSPKSVYNSLYQSHCDKLDAAGIIQNAGNGERSYTKGPAYRPAAKVLTYLTTI